MAPFSLRTENHGRSGKSVPAWQRGPGQLLTLQRQCVFSDVLSFGAASKAGHFGNPLHSVSTVSGASTSSSRSRIFNNDKVSSFAGWGLRYAEFTGQLPVLRSHEKRRSSNEPEDLPQLNEGRRNSRGRAKTDPKKRNISREDSIFVDAATAQSLQEKRERLENSRTRRRRMAISGQGQSKLQARSAVRLFGRANMDKITKLRQITDMKRFTDDEDEEPEMTLADMVAAVKKQTGVGQDEVNEMLKLFQKYDSDGSGVLDKTEVKKVLADFGLEPKTREERMEINELMLEVDTDGSGEFNFLEFGLIISKIRTKLKELQLADLQKKFLEADKDGSGDLDMSEVMTTIKQIGFEPRTDEEVAFVQAIINECDADGSGEVNFDEFETIISQVRSRLTKMRREIEMKVKHEYKISDGLFEEFRSELPALVASFKRYDRDKSGMLDREETFMVLMDAGLLPRTKAERMVIEELMSDMDTDNDGTFTFKEFLDLTYRIRILIKQREEADLLQLFQSYDHDMSGELGPQEYFKILEDFGLLPKNREEQEEIKQVLDEVDADGSGNLGFDEFQILMSKVKQQLSRLQKENDRNLAHELGFSDDQVKDFRKAFDRLDPDGGGSLTIGDLRQVLRLLHTNLTGDELRTIFESLDEDGSGTLEFCEFLRFMKLAEEGKESMRKSVHRARRASSDAEANKK